jgi:hypothetical protein
MSIRISAEWQNKPDQLAFAVRKAVIEWADETGEKVRDALKAETPVRTGRMRGSERYSRTTAGETTRLEFTANTPYAGYVINGTRPHEIRPVAARALRWIDASGVHFAKVVHHPGTKPNNFPDRVKAELKDEIIASLTDKINAALRGGG